MIREEFVTSKIILWLKNNGWTIVCYDFPQSGTGFLLHPNNLVSKNKGTIIPDIVAVKDAVGLIFENKDRFNLGDFFKIESLRETNNYSKGISVLFQGNVPNLMYYGIGFPHFEYQIEKAKSYLDKIDFLMTVDTEGEIKTIYKKPSVPI